MSTSPGKVRLIAAIGPHNELAHVGDSTLPAGMIWDVPTDGKYFHDQTKRFGGDVLMASGTWAAIGRPLSDRQTFVLSSTLPLDTPGVMVLRMLEPFLSRQRQTGRDTWIAGGQSLYEQTINAADELWLTHITGSLFREANRWFPDVPKDIFRLAYQSTVQQENGYTYQFERWDRK